MCRICRIDQSDHESRFTHHATRTMLRYSDRPLLPEMLAHGLNIIFVGAAPSYYAAETGTIMPDPETDSGNCCHQAGFTPRQLLESEDSQILEYSIGLTAIYRNVASSDNTTLPEPTEEQRESLRESLVQLNPKIVCYNGKDVYRCVRAKLIAVGAFCGGSSAILCNS